MAMEIKRNEGESIPSLIYRFNRRMQQSGILKEVKKRRFYDRAESKIKRRDSAMYKSAKALEVIRLKKLGKI